MTKKHSPDRLSPGTLTVPARTAYLSLIDDVVAWFGQEAGLSEEERRDMSLVVDEACTNVMSYAFPDGATGELSVVCTPLPDGLSVTIVDRGKPFDPKDGIAIAEKKRERDPASGGMGLLLIERFASKVQYHWDAEKGNQFTLIKYAGSRNSTRRPE